MISTSEAILLGSTMYPPNTGTQWVSKDGSCGCALGRAYLAVGGTIPSTHPVSEKEICSIWPWLAEYSNEDVTYADFISVMFIQVVKGSRTMDELIDFVSIHEPAAVEEVEESPWQKMVRGSL